MDVGDEKKLPKKNDNQRDKNELKDGDKKFHQVKPLYREEYEDENNEADFDEEFFDYDLDNDENDDDGTAQKSPNNVSISSPHSEWKSNNIDDEAVLTQQETMQLEKGDQIEDNKTSFPITINSAINIDMDKCSYCDHKEKVGESIRRHIVEFHRLPHQIDCKMRFRFCADDTTCHACGRSFQSKNKLEVHIKDYHRIKHRDYEEIFPKHKKKGAQVATLDTACVNYFKFPNLPFKPNIW